MVERDQALSTSRHSERGDDSDVSSRGLLRHAFPSALDVPSSPLLPERHRLRLANHAFQRDWGLGDLSSLLPLPLEHEWDVPADDVRSDPRSESAAPPPDVPDDEEARVLRFGPDQRLVRYAAAPLTQPPRIRAPAPRAHIN